MNAGHHINTALNNAPTVTYTAAATTFTLWGLHISDIAVILSALATMCGVALQFYVALHRIRMLERAQVAQVITSAGNAAKTEAVEKRVGDLADTVQTAVSEQTLKGIE